MPALDGVRGLAILMVLAHDFDLVETPRGKLKHLVGMALNDGWLGVQLFFVLSGFLITGILLETRDAKNYWRSFLGRRALRIFPLYYAVLFAAFVVAPLLGQTLEDAEHQIWLWTYLANWAAPLGYGVAAFPHFWSLCVEEQFYLFWPLVVRHLTVKRLAAVCVALVFAAFVSRVILRAGPLGPRAAYQFTICRVDALALGALGAMAVRAERPVAFVTKHRTLLRWGSLGAILATMLATHGAPRTGILTQGFGYTAFALAFAVMVVDVAIAPAGDGVVRALCFPPLRSVGRYSYAMYMFHSPIHIFLGMPLIDHLIGRAEPRLSFALGYFGLATIVTYVAGFASFHLFEKHFLSLKRLFEPSRATPPRPSPIV